MSEFAFVGFELCSGFLRTAAVGDGAGMVGGIAAAVAQRRRQARRNTARDWRRTPAVGRRNLTAAVMRKIMRLRDTQLAGHVKIKPVK